MVTEFPTDFSAKSSDIVFQLQPIPPTHPLPTNLPPGESISSHFSIIFKPILSRDSKSIRKRPKERLEIDSQKGGRWRGRCVGGDGLWLKNNVTSQEDGFCDGFRGGFFVLHFPKEKKKDGFCDGFWDLVSLNQRRKKGESPLENPRSISTPSSR